MQIIKRNNRQIAVGVEWSIEENGKAVSAAKKKVKKGMHLSRKLDDGILLGLVAVRMKGDLYAGAAILAAVCPDAVLCEDIGSGQVWVCATRDGTPLPGSDMVCDAADARSSVSELMSYYPSAMLIGTIAGAQKTFDDVLASVVSAKEIKGAKMLPCGTNPARIGFFAVTAAVLIGVMFFGMQAAREAKRRSSEAASLAGALKSQQALEAEKQAAIAAFRVEVEKARNEFGFRPPLGAMVDTWMSVLKMIPISYEGWAPQDIECGLTECFITWRPGNNAVPSTASRMNDVVSAATTEIKTRVAVAAPARAKTPVIVTADNAKLVMTVNSYGVFYSVPVVIDQNPSAVTISPSKPVAGLTPETIGHKGKWSMQLGQGSFAKLPVLAAKLNHMPLAVERLRVSGFGMQSSIQMEGVYVVF